MPAKVKLRVRLLSPKPDAITSRAEALREAGFDVNATPRPTGKFISHLKSENPAAILFDLDHAPSHARQTATAIRLHNSIAHFPLVFAGGEPAKAAALQAEFPDAVFTSWDKAAAAIRRAIRAQPAQPLKPPPWESRWEGRQLWQKLGIKPGMNVALLGAPEGFEESLGDLPEGVRFESRLRPQTRLALWFLRSQDELGRETPFLAARLPADASLWIVYPKQKGRIASGVTQFTVRQTALANALVDYKICAIDADWTGLKFAHRKPKP